MSWEKLSLEECIDTTKGFAFKSEWFGQDGVPVVKVKDFTADSIDSKDLSCLPASMADAYVKYTLRAGDVIIQTVGSWPSNPNSVVGKVVKVPREIDGALLNQNAVKIIPNQKLDSKFLFYLLRVDGFKKYIIGTAQGSASQASITLDAIRAYEFAVPPLLVQQKIAGILSAYDDLIDNNRKRIALLEKAARLLYDEWFVRLQFPGNEHTPVVDGVPEGWKRKTVEDIGAVITGKTPDTARASYYGEDVPFIKTPDMHGNVYVIETESSLSKEGADIQPKKYLPKNAILVACIGAKLGVVSLSPGVSQTNQQINAVVVYDKAATYFAFFTLRDFKPRLEAIGGGATMPNVNKSKFGSLDFMMPSKALLQAFDEFCKPVFAQIMTLQQQNRKLQATRDLLLPRLMSGELAV